MGEMTAHDDRVNSIREKAKGEHFDSGVYPDPLLLNTFIDGATAALTYTDADLERVAGVLLSERPSLWGGIPGDGIGLRRYLAEKALQAVGMRRADG